MSKVRIFAAAAIALVVAMALSVPASAAATSQVRMRHLAADVPPVDLYMAGLDGHWHVELRGLGFGETSPYLTVQPGTYSVALRPAGAPATSTPAVRGTVDVGSGMAYTFQASGTSKNLVQKLLVDGPAGVAPGAQPGVTVASTPATAASRLARTGTDLYVVAAGGVLCFSLGAALVVTQRRHGSRPPMHSRKGRLRSAGA